MLGTPANPCTSVLPPRVSPSDRSPEMMGAVPTAAIDCMYARGVSPAARMTLLNPAGSDVTIAGTTTR
jgi:hypothetical protein